MRKHQQKQILEILNTIREAQEAKLYMDCQSGALAIASFIEGIEGEGTETVALLAEYCELIYKSSIGEIGDKPLRRHFFKIENSVNDELKPNRIEVLFLPYQASMFDSFESIYRTAEADPDCDAYVMPIPYYDLNPDKTLGKMYYSGDGYPEDIPITNWQEYDVEKRHPDIIFTHYPYDDTAVNATIHRDFYSKRIHELCELLVHVPYYVSVFDNVNESDAFLPGILYADRSVVQSEELRQIYLGHYQKREKEPGWRETFGKAGDKFVVLGSPKLDKAVNARREDYELPPDWRDKITNPDGSYKKVILYNTHMFIWINNAEQYYQKLNDIFDIFSERDDLILWWRPHPNTELNMRQFRPQLMNEYYSLINGFKNESWGVYDDTPDLHRALVWSDAYYGDWSSLVAMFGVTGKPIVIQNITEEYCGAIDRYFAHPLREASDNAALSNVLDYAVREASDVCFALQEDGTVVGQKEAFRAMAEYPDGTSGAHIYEHVKKQVFA